MIPSKISSFIGLAVNIRMSSSEEEHGASEEVMSPESGVNARQRRKWTKEEDERLRLLVSYWGDQGGRRSNWDKISANFEDRSSKDCRKRWFHSLDPKLRRGKWSKSEDKVLKEAYQRLGPAWQRIAQLIPGRTDDQCAKRYNDVLDPSVQDRLRPWDKEEDEKLLSLHAKHGAKWQTISRCLEGRTGLTCRNRWRKLTRPSRPESTQHSSLEGDLEGSTGLGTSSRSADRTAHPSGMSRIPEGPLTSGLSFDVPGSNLVAGFPAGAEPNWLLGGGGGPGGPFGPHRNLTMTIEDPSEPPRNALQQMHHTISEIHLGRILQHAAEHKQQIVIHQHIYQTVPPAGTTSPEPTMQQTTHASLLQHPQQQSQHAPPQPPPAEHTSIAANNAPMAARTASSSVLPPPSPPDELLNRPLLFDENQAQMPMPRANHMFDADAIDFLAFNPS